MGNVNEKLATGRNFAVESITRNIDKEMHRKEWQTKGDQHFRLRQRFGMQMYLP